ncbi:MAG: radical SAM protein [Blautia sp.]
MEEINEKFYLKLLDFKQNQWKKWVEERRPFSALFELTPRCNMNCVHCYLQNVHSAEQLSYEDIISILDILYEKGILFLVLTGGEILYRKDFLEIYMYAKKRGFLVELFSNGLLFSDDIINVLKKFPPLYIDITLYGACETVYRKVTQVNGAFDKVIDNCKKIKSSGINLSLRTPIIQENENQIEAMKSIAEKLGVPFACAFEICPTVDKDNAPQNHQVNLETILKYEFDDYYRQMRNGERHDKSISDDVVNDLKNKFIFSCNVGMNSFVIDYKGNMCPCMKLKHQGIKLLGNEFDEIWKQFAKYSRMKSSKTYECSKCDSRYYCDICPAEMEFMYGDYEYREPHMCTLAKARNSFYRKEKIYLDVLKEMGKSNL